MIAVDPTVPAYICVATSMLLIVSGAVLVIVRMRAVRHDPGHAGGVVRGVLLMLAAAPVTVGGVFVPVVTAAFLVVVGAALLAFAFLAALVLAVQWAWAAWARALLGGGAGE